MRFSYGDYDHALNEAALVMSRRPIFDEAGRQYAETFTYRVSGRVLGDNEGELLEAIAGLKDAYSLQGKSARLIYVDGAVADLLTSEGALAAPRVVDGPNFPEDGQHTAEFSTWRTFEVVLEASYLAHGLPDNTIISWTETVRFSGGGPQLVVFEPINGDAIIQVSRQNSAYRAVQSGRAVGLFDYPAPPTLPAPLWPAFLLKTPDIEQGSPKRTIGDGKEPKFTEFPISWNYEFAAPAKLVGKPTRWTKG